MAAICAWFSEWPSLKLSAEYKTVSVLML